MADRSHQVNGSSGNGEATEDSSTQQLYRQMFVAHSTSQPSTRDLYHQMFSIHGIPTPRPALQQPQGMVTLEATTATQAPTWRLYRQMFATHGIPTPGPRMAGPEGISTVESNIPAQASTESLYRQMFESHGRPTPVTFQGTASAPDSVPGFYRQMFAAHADRLGEPAIQTAVQPRSRGTNTAPRSGNRDMTTRGAAAPNGQRATERRQVRFE